MVITITPAETCSILRLTHRM